MTFDPSQLMTGIALVTPGAGCGTVRKRRVPKR